MANNTDEYWEIDGVSLHQYGWSVSTLSGTRLSVPPLRGADRQFAFVAGEEFRPKVPGPKVITLNMWLTGSDPATGIPAEDQRRAWNDNWQRLRTLMWTPTRQFTLTRRLLLSDEDGDPYVQTTTTLGQYLGGLEPGMTGRTRATFSVDVKLTHPFFYGTQQTHTIDVDETATITNPGDTQTWARHVYVDLVGPLENATLTNSTPAPDVSVSYSGDVNDGQTVTLDVWQFSAMAAVDEPSIPEIDSRNRIGQISHSGAREFFGLLKGANSITLTADSGTGHAELRFRPPYL